VLLDHRERNSIRLRLHGVRSVFPDATVIEWSPPAGSPRDSVSEAIGSVTAVIAFESELADALLQLLDGAGVSVPTDLSVCTFDQGTIETQRPGFVTHIRQPLYRLGATAIETALALRSSEGDATALVNLLPCRLVVGTSTAPPVSTTRG
jgi:DNA-binding LacI/PurR family transcriptional regulator